MAVTILSPVAIVMVAVAASALGVGVLQTGGVSFYSRRLGFKPDRINPISNAKNLFSLRSAGAWLKSLLPAEHTRRDYHAAPDGKRSRFHHSL